MKDWLATPLLRVHLQHLLHRLFNASPQIALKTLHQCHSPVEFCPAESTSMRPRSRNASNECPCDEHCYTIRMAIPPSTAIVSPVIKSWVTCIAITAATSSGFPSPAQPLPFQDRRGYITLIGWRIALVSVGVYIVSEMA